MVFARHPKDQKTKELMESAHWCHDFDALQDWAFAHRLLEKLDNVAKVPNDPLGWGDLYISDWILANRPPSFIDPE